MPHSLVAAEGRNPHHLLDTLVVLGSPAVLDLGILADLGSPAVLDLGILADLGSPVDLDLGIPVGYSLDSFWKVKMGQVTYIMEV